MSKTLSPPNALFHDVPPSAPAVPVSVAPPNEGSKFAFGVTLVLTFIVFARPEDVFPAFGALHLTLIMSILAPLACLVSLVTGHSRFQKSSELFIVLALTVWFTAGVPFAFWHTGSFDTLTQTWLRTLLFFLVLTQTLTSVGRIRKILWVFLISELIATTASLLTPGHATGDEDRLAGVSAGIFAWNFLGIALSVALPFMAALYISRRSAFRTSLLLATAGTSMWMLVLVASRGGFLNVIVSIILSFVLILRGTKRARFIGLIFVIGFGVMIGRAPGVFWDRIQTIWGGSTSTSNRNVVSAQESTDGREMLLQNSIKYTLENPVFGVGVGNFPVYNGQMLHRSDAWYGTHNTYTQASAEAGIPALVLLLILLATMITHAKKAATIFARDPADDELRLIATATLTALLSAVFGIFFMHILYNFLLYYLAAITGALWAIARQRTAGIKSQVVPAAPIDALPVPVRRIPEWRLR
ncbi:MAG: O-antigen ligase family protein [Candidatus Acidiferrales bacterium]|jgi:O-antigen ligase